LISFLLESRGERGKLADSSNIALGM